MMKSDQKWLDSSTKTGAHQPQIPINPAFKTRSRAKLCVKGPNHSTDGQKGLFKAQNSSNVEGRPFYLGNVGLRRQISYSLVFTSLLRWQVESARNKMLNFNFLVKG